MRRKVGDAPQGAGFRIVAGKDDFFDTGLQQRANAHQARLEGDVQRRTGQAMVTRRPAGPTQGDDLGMGARIAIADRLIASAAEHGAGADHQGAHRNFATRRRGPRLAEALVHPTLVHLCHAAAPLAAPGVLPRRRHAAIHGARMLYNVGQEVVLMSAPGRFRIVEVDGDVITIENDAGIRRKVLESAVRPVAAANS